MATVIGLVTYKGAIAGVELQDVTYGETASTVEPLREDGSVDSIGVYGKKKTIAANGNVKADAALTALTVGGILKVDSVDYTITSISVKESVSGAKTLSVSGEAPYSAASAEPPAGT